MMSDAGFRAWFVFCTLVSLAVTGVLVWALITLVEWPRR